jgi:hypothetical protein
MDDAPGNASDQGIPQEAPHRQSATEPLIVNPRHDGQSHATNTDSQAISSYGIGSDTQGHLRVHVPSLSDPSIPAPVTNSTNTASASLSSYEAPSATTASILATTSKICWDDSIMAAPPKEAKANATTSYGADAIQGSMLDKAQPAIVPQTTLPTAETATTAPASYPIYTHRPMASATGASTNNNMIAPNHYAMATSVNTKPMHLPASDTSMVTHAPPPTEETATLAVTAYPVSTSELGPSTVAMEILPIKPVPTTPASIPIMAPTFPLPAPATASLPGPAPAEETATTTTGVTRPLDYQSRHEAARQYALSTSSKKRVAPEGTAAVFAPTPVRKTAKPAAAKPTAAKPAAAKPAAAKPAAAKPAAAKPTETPTAAATATAATTVASLTTVAATSIPAAPHETTTSVAAAAAPAAAASSTTHDANSAAAAAHAAYASYAYYAYYYPYYATQPPPGYEGKWPPAQPPGYDFPPGYPQSQPQQQPTSTQLQQQTSQNNKSSTSSSYRQATAASRPETTTGYNTATGRPVVTGEASGAARPKENFPKLAGPYTRAINQPPKTAGKSMASSLTRKGSKSTSARKEMGVTPNIKNQALDPTLGLLARKFCNLIHVGSSASGSWF